MSYCEKPDGGKDFIFHLSPEDLKDVEDPQKAYGAFDPVRREIDWECPCIGGAMKGPCAQEFKQAFSCFVFSEEEDKGSECYTEFLGLNKCFAENSEYYEKEKQREAEERKSRGEEEEAQEAEGKAEEKEKELAGEGHELQQEGKGEQAQAH